MRNRSLVLSALVLALLMVSVPAALAAAPPDTPAIIKHVTFEPDSPDTLTNYTGFNPWNMSTEPSATWGKVTGSASQGTHSYWCAGSPSGVLGAYVLLFPHAHVLVFMPGIGMTRVAAGIVLGMWFILQLLSGGMSIGSTGGGVAFFAHIGGFVAGMVLIGFFKRPEVRFFSPERIGRWDE